VRQQTRPRLVASRRWPAAPLNRAFFLPTSGHITLAPTPTPTSKGMDAEQQADAEMGAGPSSEFTSHEMRITQGGKVRAWVEFALKFFEACIPGQIY